jgi:hypothetical protein
MCCFIKGVFFSTAGEAPLETDNRVSVEGSYYEEYSQYGEFRYSVESQGNEYSQYTETLSSHKVRSTLNSPILCRVTR